MATSAFRSTTKRAPLAKPSANADDSSSSSRSSSHRRYRSLSRFSHRLPSQDAGELVEETPPTRGKFVNTMRGSGFPDVSLDDLAVELFSSFSGGGDRGRSSSRKAGVSPSDSGGGVGASQRRGRSVARQGSKGNVVNNGGGGRVAPESGNSRRRRSVSVVRHQISDSESDLDVSKKSSHHGNKRSSISRNNQMPTSHKLPASDQRPGLRRSFSQNDFKCHDDYSSQSSTLTDDEGKDVHSTKKGIERKIRAVYTQKKAENHAEDDLNSGLYEAMREELMHAVEGIRMGLEQEKTKNSFVGSDDCSQAKASDVLQAVSTIRNYTTKLEQSEKRKQDLLAEILLEEQRGRELSKIVKDLIPDPKNSIVEMPVRARKRSNDHTRMSRCLTEEAEKYIEDFILNIEETDISSLDGERSDTSSSLGGMIRPETFQSPAVSKSVPAEMDGVVLPWLQWDTPNDVSPLSCKNKMEPVAITKSNLWDAPQGLTATQDISIHSTSSRGSWSPATSMTTGEDRRSKFGELGSYQSRSSASGTTRLQFDVNDYLNLRSNEELLSERWSQRHRINSGSLLFCNHMFL